MALDPHSAQVSLLLHCDGVDGSTSIVDSSARPKTVAAFGNAAISTAHGKFGGSCLSMSAGGGYLMLPASAEYEFAAADFTMEMWVKTTGLNGALINATYEEDATWWDLIFYQGKLIWADYQNITNLLEGDIPINDGSWHHIAVVRLANELSCYVDGVLDARSSFDPLSIPNFSEALDLVVGKYTTFDATSYNFSGQIDELRITKGVARYTSSFTPPTEPFQIQEAAAGVVTASASAPAMLGQPRVLANLPKAMVWVSADSPLGVSGPSVLAVRVEYDVFSPASLQPVRFGGALLLAEMPPVLTAFQAASLVAGRFGVPSCASRLQAGDVQSTSPVRFGVPRATFSAAAQSIASTNFGAPALSVVSPAGSLRTSRFGVPRLTCALGAQHVRGVRFGVPSLNLPSGLFGVSSLAPVRMGEPYLRGVALRARALCGTHFGTPSLERGPLC